MKVVIIGAGFGGLTLARKLNNKPGFEVMLIDKFNYHQFQPLFYQVASAGLDPSNISFPLRKIFQKSKNVRIRMDEVKQVLPAENKIITETEEIIYDILVLATGADTNFFGNAKISANAFPMKSTVEALQLRYRLLKNLEDAVTLKDEEERQRLMNIVVVGGGPTGVEVAGALAELKKYVLPKEYPELDFSKMNIYLLEGLKMTLAAMSETSSVRSCKYLRRLGVIVRTETLVDDYDGEDVKLNNGDKIPSATVIWAAGIKGNVPAGIMSELIAVGNRINVNRQCQVESYHNIYAIGDLAYMETPKYPGAHPQVAPVAMQQAAMLAENLIRKERKLLTFYDFEYHNSGTMATIGRNLAVGDIPMPKFFRTKLHLGGFPAWLLWMGLHLFLILGMKNRLFVLLNWIYNYVTYDQSLRLIFKKFNTAQPGLQMTFENSGNKICSTANVNQ